MKADNKKISVMVATSVSLGAIIGAGIYVLSGTAIALAGPEALIAFVLVGMVALMVAFQLGELGAMMPKLKGASYSYAYKAFGSEIGFITGIMLVFSYATTITVISLGFGSYLASVLGITIAGYPIAFAIALIAVLGVVNILGITKAAKADFVLVVIKILILMLFVGAGLYLAFTHAGAASPFSNLTNGASGGLKGLFAASVVVFFAYSGFQTVSTFTDKVKGEARGAAKAIIYSVVISIALYVVVTLTLMLMLPTSAYNISGDPLAFALTHTGAPQWLFVVVDIGALIATASAALANILKSSRLIYQIGVDGLLPKLTKNYNKSTDVAVNGVIISCVIGIVMLFAGNIYVIASISNVGIFISYLMTCFALIHFRKQGVKSSFKSPFYPIISIISIIALLVFFAGLPTEALLIGIVMILSLLIIYYSLREAESKKVVKVKLFR